MVLYDKWRFFFENLNMDNSTHLLSFRARFGTDTEGGLWLSLSWTRCLRFRVDELRTSISELRIASSELRTAISELKATFGVFGGASS